MPEPGLRELKKARTRRLIAGTAARLFAERGCRGTVLGLGEGVQRRANLA